MSKEKKMWCEVCNKITDHKVSCTHNESTLSPTCSTAGADKEIASVVFEHIDRMNDYCDEDQAQKILDEFTKEVMPAIDRWLESR